MQAWRNSYLGQQIFQVGLDSKAGLSAAAGDAWSMGDLPHPADLSHEWLLLLFPLPVPGLWRRRKDLQLILFVCEGEGFSLSVMLMPASHSTVNSLLFMTFKLAHTLSHLFCLCLGGGVGVGGIPEHAQCAWGYDWTSEWVSAISITVVFKVKSWASFCNLAASRHASKQSCYKVKLCSLAETAPHSRQKTLSIALCP